MATGFTKARAIAKGFTGLRSMVTGSTSIGLGLLAQLELEPQSLVLLVQDAWVLVLVEPEP